MLSPETQALWDAEPGWLDTASYGLPPRPAWDALTEALAAWRRGRGSWEDWTRSTEAARACFARLVGTDVASVAIGSAASELVGLVAASLPKGAKVVVPDIEFTSNLFPWLVQAEHGVEVLTVPPASLAESVDARTTLVAFSAVQSSTGEVADLDAIAGAAERYGALTVVDATQCCGWLPLDATRFDAVVCGAYKWLMSPRGTAFGAFSERLGEQLLPLYAGWYAGADVHDSYYGPPLRLASSARRFDVSPSWFSWVGTAPTLAVVEGIGIDAIHSHDVALANRFCAGLGLPPADSAIVSCSIHGATERLARAGIRAPTRAGRLRASFHLYNTAAEVDAALDALTA
ncbi:MAG: aminotransferase class V-fold PLP-dependent enzyme [Acidimicrobiales bacterium]